MPATLRMERNTDGRAGNMDVSVCTHVAGADVRRRRGLAARLHAHGRLHHLGAAACHPAWYSFSVWGWRRLLPHHVRAGASACGSPSVGDLSLQDMDADLRDLHHKTSIVNEMATTAR